MQTITSLVELLASPLASALVDAHPNHALQTTNPHILSIFDWAAGHPDPWLAILRVYDHDRVPSDKPPLPQDLEHFLRASAALSLSRSVQSPIHLHPSAPREHAVPIAGPPPHLIIPGTPESDSAPPPHTQQRHRPGSPIVHIQSPFGMSLKKSHEVQQMSDYIRLSLLPRLPVEVKHVVDVGAGQGYLSRELSSAFGLHVLALDSSITQTHGALRRDVRAPRQKGGAAALSLMRCNDTNSFGELVISPKTALPGSLMHKTAHITPQNLEQAVSEWLDPETDALTTTNEERTSSPARDGPTPVLLVALHACGELTPDILRVATWRINSAGSRKWFVAGTVVVGCCYNMLPPPPSPSSFPLSSTARSLSSRSSSDIPPLVLNSQHLQLAAQVPNEWLRSSGSTAAARLATRKVVFRAFLEPFMKPLGDKARLGKLNDNAYEDWPSFLAVAARKLGMTIHNKEEDARRDVEREKATKQLSALHALRCCLGPAVESLIILDRLAWLNEALSDSSIGGTASDGTSPEILRSQSPRGDKNLNAEARLVNLFDQSTGSARNIAVVVAPAQCFECQ